MRLCETTFWRRCQVVPHALLEFSRSVLQGTFASVVQKQAWRYGHCKDVTHCYALKNNCVTATFCRCPHSNAIVLLTLTSISHWPWMLQLGNYWHGRMAVLRCFQGKHVPPWLFYAVFSWGQTTGRSDCHNTRWCQALISEHHWDKHVMVKHVQTILVNFNQTICQFVAERNLTQLTKSQFFKPSASLLRWSPRCWDSWSSLKSPVIGVLKLTQTSCKH